MKAIKWMLGLWLAGSLAVQADDTAFWRIKSSATSVVTTIDVNGTLAWSNSTPGNNEKVQRATVLSPIANWQDYVLVLATGTETSVQVFGLYPPENMVLIPAGVFMMGNATNVFPASEGYTDELPQHRVYVSAFYMDQYLVTKALWDEVKTWAATNGYAFATGLGKGTNHPVHTVSWYDMVKWCNARSEQASLTPCYTTNGVTYKTGSNITVVCTWSANGYRLPTEAEWEKAARGGVANTRFPWTDYTNRISHAKANYYGDSGSTSYDLSHGYNPDYVGGGFPYSSPVGSFGPNGYGLYDMAGNMWERVWDWWSDGYYAISPDTNPTGPDSGTSRMMRGGSWLNGDERCSDRSAFEPGTARYDFGFRCAKGR